MKPRFVFLVGAPGAGKTSLARLLIEPGSVINDAPKWTIGKSVVAAGHYLGGTFDGADTVPYNGVQAALGWWDSALWDRAVTIFDGDRFSSAKVLDWAQFRGVAQVIHVVASDELLQQRRRQRGSAQNEAWAKGRKTKSDRFAQMVPEDRRLEIAGGMLPEDQAALVKGWGGWPF